MFMIHLHNTLKLHRLLFCIGPTVKPVISGHVTSGPPHIQTSS